MDKETSDKIREVIIEHERLHDSQRLRQRAQKIAHRIGQEAPISGQGDLRVALK